MATSAFEKKPRCLDLCDDARGARAKGGGEEGAAAGSSGKRHRRYGIEVAADRYFSVNGPAMDRLPHWAAARDVDGVALRLHPPISYEIHYRVPSWVMVFAYTSADTRGAFDDDTLADGRRKRGSACLIPPGTRVRIIQEKPQEFLGVGIPSDRFDSLAKTAAGAGGWSGDRVYSDGDPALAALCGEMRRVMTDEPEASGAYLGSLVDAAAARMLGAELGRAEIGADASADDGRERLAAGVRRRVAADIDRRLGEKLSVSALAEEAGLSRSHFTRAFSASFGESPARYILERRVARARALLVETDHPVTEIALSCGFADHAHFSTAFRKEVGLAPSAYRKAAAGRDERAATPSAGVTGEAARPNGRLSRGRL